MYDLETSGTGHLENIGITDKDLSKEPLYILTHNLMVMVQSFPNLNFHLKAQILSLITYIVSCFLKYQAPFVHYQTNKKMSAIFLKKHGFSMSCFFQGKIVFQK